MRRFALFVFACVLCLVRPAATTHKKRHLPRAPGDDAIARDEKGGSQPVSFLNLKFDRTGSISGPQPLSIDPRFMGRGQGLTDPAKIVRVDAIHERSDIERQYDRVVNQPADLAEDCDCGQSPAGESACPGGSPGSHSKSGRENLNRIVGGEVVAPEHKYPWQAYLQVCESRQLCFMCGGSLVNRRWIVTAMHCVTKEDGGTRTDIVVKLGRQDMGDMSADIYNNYHVDKIVLNPNYRASFIENDLVLLRLSAAVVFNDEVRPVCLPSSNLNDYAGREAVVTGWGNTKFEGTSSRFLQEAVLNVLSSKDVKCRLGVATGYVPPTKLCAYKRGKDACQGDSGGPLTLAEDGRCTLIGVTSYGIDCATPGMAGVYTRVSEYLPWIKETIQDGNCGNKTETPTSPDDCDLTCTNVDRLTGKFELDHVPSECEGGHCKSLDPNTNLCAALGSPCSKVEVVTKSEVLHCRQPCNLNDYIGDFIDQHNAADLETLVNLKVYDVMVTCDKNTRECCQIGDPDESLCSKVYQAYLSHQTSSLFGK